MFGACTVHNLYRRVAASACSTARHDNASDTRTDTSTDPADPGHQSPGVREGRRTAAFDSKTQAKRNIVRAIERVAHRLGNTPALCRKSYVHPAA
jgi:hypothetical protein